MSSLSRDAVLKLAQLSRLKLTNEEIDRFCKELSEILAYVQMLEKVDVKGLTPTYQVTGLKNVMRNDEISKYVAQPNELLKNAPRLDRGHFKVKRIVG